MEDKIAQQRRIGVLSGHVSGEGVPKTIKSESSTSISNSLIPNTCNTVQLDRSRVPHASATGLESNYSKVHGKVSSRPVQWIDIVSVAGKPLEETIYQKSKGEGIAKVGGVCSVTRS